jgi:hypothetical protein
MGMTDKARHRFFVLVILNLSLRTGLILPHLLGLDFVSFPRSMPLLFSYIIFFSTYILKKKWGRRCRILFYFYFFLLIAFQISYVFFS